MKTIAKKILPRIVKEKLKQLVGKVKVSNANSPISRKQINDAVIKIACPNPNKIRLILQLESFDKGGLEEVVLSLVKGIDQTQFDLYLVVVDSVLGYVGKLAADYLGYERVVCLSHSKALLLAALNKIMPQVVNTHYSIFGYEIYKKYSVKIIDTVHNNYIWLTNERDQFNLNVDKFIAVSSQVKQHYSQKFSVDEAKIIVIPNGLDVSHIRIESVTREELGYTAGNYIFINVASFNYNKAQLLSIAAFKKVVQKIPEARLLFVGNILDESYYSSVIQTIKDFDLSDKVQVLSYVQKEKIYGLLQISDCFLFPSLIEGWSIAVMEAMYMNLLLILSDIGSARDVIQNDDIGMIIPNPFADPVLLNIDKVINGFNHPDKFSNINKLEAAMLDIMKRSVSNIARQKIIEQFNLDNMIRKYESIYNGELI